eukprot:5278182-Pyramimonas_sp.AAC.1
MKLALGSGTVVVPRNGWQEPGSIMKPGKFKQRKHIVRLTSWLVAKLRWTTPTTWQCCSARVDARADR